MQVKDIIQDAFERAGLRVPKNLPKIAEAVEERLQKYKEWERDKYILHELIVLLEENLELD